ncbi:hypothetical protein QAD02_006776 [Eretmocerus hayati]|uniref:Uncharacterized protein n=1 Tax=Eretmocerus hayati TaxID=131215 RepID=A0ACC2N251_9HYME|nr:hypothetical protein QAD02_006776 [Eretmocerus hayati]
MAMADITSDLILDAYRAQGLKGLVGLLGKDENVSMQIELFLTKYQTLKAMVLFLKNNVYQLLRNLMSRVIQQKSIDEMKCVKDLSEVDLNDASMLQSMKTTDISFAAPDLLDKLPTSVVEKDISVFKLK